MAEGFWEQAVENYLKTDRGLFLNSQYLIGEPGGWKAEPDFLAINFPDDEIWAVEVTRSAGKKIRSKILEFELHYKPRIVEQLVKHRVIRDDPSKWKLGMWLFVPSAQVSKTGLDAKTAGINVRVTSLEEATFFDWNKRFR